MVTGLIVGSMINRIICVARCVCELKKKAQIDIQVIVFVFPTWICTGVVEASGVPHGAVSVMPFFFFFLSLEAY